MFLNFITRTVFIKTLGESYLGINGLYNNILTVLSLSDLGIGTAIIFKLYKPIEEKDEDRIVALMQLYRRLYLYVGFVVAILGICVAPFLKVIIKDYDRLLALHLNPVLILLLYVFRAASSYWFFAYKRSMVYAHQKTYLLTVRGYLISCLSCVTQILVLLYWNDRIISTFIAYTAVVILFTIIENIVFARVADKHFPYLKKKTKTRISKEEIKELFKNCSALFLYRANDAVISATDNIALAAMLNLSTVGLYSNYSLLYSNIKTFPNRIIESIGASIGSIHATGNRQWKINIFETINLASIMLYGVIAVPLALCGDEFIRVWIGERYLLNTVTFCGRIYPLSIAYLIGLELFILSYASFLGRFRVSFGLFRQLKYRPILSMIVNLVFTILLVPILGVAGTIISTIISHMTTIMVFDPYVIIRKELHSSLAKYHLKNTGYFAVTFIAAAASFLACRATPGNGVLYFIIHGSLCVIITGFFYLLFFGRSREMRMLLTFIPNAKLRTLAHKILLIPQTSDASFGSDPET